ncbi:hypothetical protein BP6252_06738 [Coleophoma cylindrospora]|uniref:Uncharacterized protein n=1 Tax=Coleophoma cylindrospora TaxID=1849047 RepID=A0A3D8RG40_9HELO|nr:hypothetical protein BP6252_06738 [Coleophoma cylindrospora]
MPMDPLKQSQLREEIELDSRLDFATVHRRRRLIPALSSLPWVLVVALSLLSIYLYRTASDRPGFNNGWETDFGPAKSALRIKQVRFTGSPGFTENGTFYVPNSGPVQYVGLPTPEIDEAWHELTKNRYIKITEEEAKNTWPENYRDFWDSNYNAYIAG